jgi:hypothetical protein
VADLGVEKAMVEAVDLQPLAIVIGQPNWGLVLTREAITRGLGELVDQSRSAEDEGSVVSRCGSGADGLADDGGGKALAAVEEHDVHGGAGEGLEESLNKRNKLNIGNGGIKADSRSRRRGSSSNLAGVAVEQAMAMLCRGHVTREGGGVVASHIAQQAGEVIEVYQPPPLRRRRRSGG